MRRKLVTAVLLALSTALTGCVDLPVVGNLGDQIRPILPEFIRDKIFPADQTAATTKAAPAKRQRRRRLNNSSPTAAAGADTPDVTPETPRENVAVLYEQFLTRNMEFDHLRTQGIEQLISGQTEKAIESFKAALAKKPGDKSVEDLLQLAENPPLRPLDGGEGIPGGTMPDSVPNLPGSFPRN